MKINDNSGYGRAGLPDGVQACDKRLSLMVTADELDLLRRACNGGSLSAWMRRTVVTAADRKVRT